MRIHLTSRQVYAAVAIVMVLTMAVFGSGLLSPPDQPINSPDSSGEDQAQPARPTFAPPEGTPQVSLGPTYLHPSAYFEIIPPVGWMLDELNEVNVASASWVNSAQGAVLHAFVLPYEQPVTRDELINRVDGEFATGFGNFDSYTVVNRNYDGDPLVVDFSVSLDGQNYIAREWASALENVIWVLRVVVPENYTALLAYLEQNVLPTYRVFADARPAPADWESYTDQERWYTFRHPPGWANLGTGRDGARRFGDSATGWQAEMAILVQPGTAVRAAEGARAWLKALEPGAEISTVETAERAHGAAGYVVSFAYPVENGNRRGLLLLLNANDAVYRVDLRLPPGADDPLNTEAQKRADEAIRALDTFRPLPASGPIPTPVLGGAAATTGTETPTAEDAGDSSQ